MTTTAADFAGVVAAGYCAVIISAHAADLIIAADRALVVAAGYYAAIRSAHAADKLTTTAADFAGVVAAGYCAAIFSAHAADIISAAEIRINNTYILYCAAITSEQTDII